MSPRVLITGIAALLLATGAAHADAEWDCGEIRVTETRLTSDHLAELSFRVLP